MDGCLLARQVMRRDVGPPHPVLIVEIKDEYVERQRNYYPDAGPRQRFRNADHVRFAVKHAEIEHYERENKYQERDPDDDQQMPPFDVVCARNTSMFPSNCRLDLMQRQSTV